MTKIIQDIQNEFIDKFPELKDFPALAMEMQTFLHQACIRYAQGIVPEKLPTLPCELPSCSNSRTCRCTTNAFHNIAINKMTDRIQEDTLPIS